LPEINEKTLEKLNKVYQFLAPHGGDIEIEEDWIFSMNVQQYEDGEYYLYMCSKEDYPQRHFRDPLFRVNVKFDEKREHILSATPVAYLSQTPLGDMYIDENDDIDGFGIKEHTDGIMHENFDSYLTTLTELRPYLTNPTAVYRFKKDNLYYAPRI
jgi:hypothetical protein